MIGSVLRRARAVDARLTRDPHRRRVLVDARTPVNYTMVAPIVQRMRDDPRLEFFFTASDEPRRVAEIYRQAPGVTLIHPLRAALMRFDAYVASDFMWASLPRGTRRIQVFHGVGGKYGFDAPTTSMRQWDRLFFVNRRRLENFVKAGAIDAGSPAIRLIGYPKADCLVNGTFTRQHVLAALGLDPDRPTVLYAPTWSPASSLNAMGLDVVSALLRRRLNVIVKLHDRSLDPRERYSGGVNWVEAMKPVLTPGAGALAAGSDISPYLVAADVMITDHSSAGFEYLLLDRPLVRIHRPALLNLANVHPDYAALLASVSQSVDTRDQVVAAVETALDDPDRRRAERRAVAADLFYRPGTATTRSVAALYDAIELEPVSVTATAGEMTCQPSA